MTVLYVQQDSLQVTTGRSIMLHNLQQESCSDANVVISAEDGEKHGLILSQNQKYRKAFQLCQKIASLVCLQCVNLNRSFQYFRVFSIHGIAMLILEIKP